MSTGYFARLGMSRVPSPLMLAHRIQDGEEYVPAGGKRHVRPLSGGAQPLGERPEHRIVAHGGHVLSAKTP